MRIREKTTTVVATLFLTATIGYPLSAGAGTPDGQTPSQELVCDEAALERNAFGLCIAFCEASDCDTHPKRASCRSLRKNYERATGESLFPCEVPEPPSCESPFYCGS